MKSAAFIKPALNEDEIVNELAICSVDRVSQVVQYLESVGHRYGAPMRKWLNAWLDSPRSAARLFMDIVSHAGDRAQSTMIMMRWLAFF